MNDEVSPVKRGPGRPPKAKPEGATQALSAASRHKMKAKPNWEDADDLPDEGSPDRLRIDRSLIPEGMDLQWVTDSIFGQPQPQHRAEFEKRGWTPVHQEDFDGQFDGMFMPKGAEGEIKIDGLVLMARPIELTIKARRLNKRQADEQVQIKEKALRGGDIPGVSLDSTHPNAVKTNRINKSYERINIPED